MTVILVVAFALAVLLLLWWLRGGTAESKTPDLAQPKSPRGVTSTAASAKVPETENKRGSAGSTAPERGSLKGPAAPPVDSPETTEAATAESVPPGSGDRPSPSVRDGDAEQPTDVPALRRGLEKARAADGFFGRLVALFRGKAELAPSIATDIEEVLLSSDVGVETTNTILARVRETLTRGDLSSPDAVWAALKEEAVRILSCGSQPTGVSYSRKPTVILLVGVNGAGKTTSAGKLAARLKADGKTVVMAAADTFRAAAVHQLVAWGDRIGVEVVRGKDGGDPGAVVFDAVQRAQTTGTDVVLVDTAGRLHTKANLMAELKRVVRTTGKALEGAPHEILLVIDATNGQNAMAQAREFCEALPVTGVVLTKLDGTARGGVVLAISDALKLPVRFVGLGETAHDLRDFRPTEFVEALLGTDD